MKSILMIPVLAVGTTFADSHQAPASASNSAERNLAITQPMSASSGHQTNFVLQRKERIQNVLITLDRVAQLTTQMKPETADRVEPVIVDLAEQTIDLANEKALLSNDTDVALRKIETTVNELVKTMNRYVEPEASL